MNLSAPQTFRSKEISKSNVVDDMVASNSILYAPGEHPDHVIVIKVFLSLLQPCSQCFQAISALISDSKLSAFTPILESSS